MPEESLEIWLMRHGETEWSRSGQHTGRTDLPLTKEGERRARALGEYLANRSFDLVLSSPLARAADTCRLAGYGEQAQVTDDLMEWDYGKYEGRLTADIQHEHPGWTIWRDGAPGGESVTQVAQRARRVIARASDNGGAVALFAHGHLLRVLAACWLGLSPDMGRLLALDTASASVLGYEHDSRVVRMWNRPIGHPSLGM